MSAYFLQQGKHELLGSYHFVVSEGAKKLPLAVLKERKFQILEKALKEKRIISYLVITSLVLLYPFRFFHTIEIEGKKE